MSQGWPRLVVRGLPGSQRDKKFTTFQTFKTSCDFVTPVVEAVTGATLRSIDLDWYQQFIDRLDACHSQLGGVLTPWGFNFEHQGVQSSHSGPFATGLYSRGTTRIHLSCRATIDNIYYEHSFVTEFRWGTREIERFTIDHGTLMKALGHFDDCMLVSINKYPDYIAARNGGDRVSALIHDLNTIASPVLCEPCDAFYEIIRLGYRHFLIE